MKPATLAAAIATTLKPARLDVSMPFELPQGNKDAIADAIAGEAWLKRLGLEGLLTGIAGADVKTFRNSVERLVGMLRYARQVGRDEARAEVVRDFDETAVPRWRRRVGIGALVGLGVGVAFGALLF